MIRWQKIFLVLILFSSFLYSQNHILKFEHLTTDDGLSGSVVECIFQDSKGFMWFGTRSGLNKYDGYKFTIYRHDNNDPNSVSHSWIHGGFQEDSKGNLWFGTWGGGLNIFDHEKEVFYHYKHDDKNPNSLCDDNIFHIYEDRSGNLWLSTTSGLSKIVNYEQYDFRKNIQFVNYKHDPENPYSLSYDYIYSVYEDSQGTLWIGTRAGGINILEKNSEKFLNKENYNGEKYKILHHPEFRSGVSWFDEYPEDYGKFVTVGATGDYIFKINIKNGSITDFSKQVSENYKIPINKIGQYIEYTKSHNFVHMLNAAGLYVINKNKKKAYALYPDLRNPFSISNNIIECWHTDKNGIIWIGTLNGGINKYVKHKDIFEILNVNIDNSASSVMSLYEDFAENDTVLWIGAGQHGLIRYNKKTNALKQITNKASPRALCQLKSDPNVIWFGTIGRGLYRYNKEKNILSNQSYYLPQEIKKTYGILIILSMTGDDQGNLWIGSLAGLIKFNTKTKEFRHYKNDINDLSSLSNNVINALCYSTYQDKPVLWVGTRYGGLNRFDPVSEKFIRYRNDPDDSLSIGGDYISAISEDNSGNLWVGTVAGLQKYDRENNNFIHYTDKGRLLNIDIMGILQENDSLFWLHTKSGICRFNIQNKNIRFFDKYDGLPGKDFHRYAFCKGQSGHFYFGINNNILTFKPEKYRKNSNIPPVVITDFQIFNKSVKPGENSPLSKSISNTNKLILPYDQSVFSFEFASLDYFDPTKNRYAYKMEGVDPDWVYTDASRRFATYTNLDPGEYTFSVKGSNNDGIWNEKGTSVKVIITPPWWQTNLAYGVYLIFIVSVIFGAWRLQTNRLKMKQQVQMEHFEADKLREVDKLKTRFFANISHEFRTPLTLIKGPAYQIMGGTFTGGLKDQCRMIIRNSDRLLGLINQILDISKLESGEITLKVAETEIVKYLKGMVMSFSSLAESKNIDLKFNSKIKSLIGYVDHDKLEKIITNLLSNAFKFTPEGGEIKVSLRGVLKKNWIPDQVRDDDEAILSREGIVLPRHTGTRDDKSTPLIKGGRYGGIVITVSNTGPGIPVGQLSKIFDRFYQVNDDDNKDHQGTGIGLSLTKELVEISRGKISVSSIPDKRTEFVVVLPVSKEYFAQEEIIDKTDASAEIYFYPDRSYLHEKAESFLNDDEETTSEKPLKTKVKKYAPLLLIVEDNADVVTYISSVFENDYRIITAENGKAGYKKVLMKNPNLVISDVMMPVMDGFQFCKLMKSDHRTSHIPLIMLTARADMDSKLNGLEFGADDYITKPFDARELALRAKNILAQRHRLQEHFHREVDFRAADITVNSIDEQFMQKTVELIENHLADTGFGVDQFSQELGMSSRHLSRKLKAITNHATGDFIRTMRLKHAAQLIKNKSEQVTQIAYRVGFENPSYFAQCFRKQFGMTPSEYATKNTG